MLWPAILSFVIAFALLRVLLWRFGTLALDQPNARSLHERPVPRTGGIAILLGASVAMGFGADALWLPFVLAVALGVLSFMDDVRSVPLALRLSAHLAAAGLFSWQTLGPIHPAQIALLVISVVWITNLYNFMDGADGLAGGMASFGFAACAAAAWLAGHAPLAVLSVALAAALGIQGWRDGAWPLWFPVLVFGPFIADATITLCRRAIRGERVWLAHREHYYQRMVRMGLGHRRTAWIGYGAMLICALAALYGRAQPAVGQAVAFIGASACLAGLAIWVDIRWARSAK